MMPFEMLIIDDEMARGKGYQQIAIRYPGVFKIEEAAAFTVCDLIRDPEQVALTKLMRHKYDLILLDCGFVIHEEQGVDMVVLIRSGFAGRPEAKAGGGLNRDTYIIGVSDFWDEMKKILERHLKQHGLERGLDGWTHKRQADAQGLCAELDKFLVSRDVNTAKVRAL